ncbi:putative actin-like ATPase [Desulfuromonas soudanensis]|uniref:Putative actin-like ATPase n=1 Tax=Desulfuromonas soudanensis TaxID=1603606 RepID=A0A0M4D868_9BACT|nr:rod shape-determining protein [Desulfuromonas soudanensis]ALC15830.1 putative actin-like ATPase [Desulfuromonas soudanensis]
MKKHRVPFACRNEVAIDVGTAFIRLATAKFGVVVIPTMSMSEPPLQHGVVANSQKLTEIVRPFLNRAKKLGLLSPRVIVGSPTDASEEERETLMAALFAADAASVEIISEPFAAAIGIGMDFCNPYTQLIVDVGDGVTDCAVIRGNEILDTHASRVGCGTLRESIKDCFLRCWGLSLLSSETERIIASAGVAQNKLTDNKIQVGTGNNKDASPIPIIIRQASIHAMIEPAILKIIDTVTNLLRKVPPAFGCEIIESGIILTGGGALLPGLRERLAERTSIRVTIPEKPLDAVIGGLGDMLVHT